VILVYEGLNPAGAETIKAHLDAQLALLSRYVGWSASECYIYNGHLRSLLAAAVAEQRLKVLADRRIEAALDIPVKRRGDSDSVINIALPRRRREVPHQSTVNRGLRAGGE